MKKKPSLLPVARRLHKVGHKCSPSVTCNSGPDGFTIVAKFKASGDLFDFYSAFISFFCATRRSLQRKKGKRAE